MKVAGIVAEYNPFHNGHKYHIDETKKQTGADYIIAVMSGDFVQRGAPAIIDKYRRTACALANGCDLVLELPIIYSTASAEYFATGAVSLLDKLGVCDFLSFGSEAGTTEHLSMIANILLNEPESYKNHLKMQLKSGSSYPAARAFALKEYFSSKTNCQFSNDFWKEFEGSNNILALEYLKTLEKSKSKLTPFTIHRKNAPYHDKKLHENISSATAVRKFSLEHDDISPIMASVPSETFAELSENHAINSLLDANHLTPYLHMAILNEQSLQDLMDWDENLANRMDNLTWQTMDFSTIAKELKSRNITQTRIQRALLHLILQIDKHSFFEQYNNNPIPYAKILGFRKESSLLLKEIKNNSSIPLVTKPADGKKQIEKAASWMWDMDIKAATLYQSMMFQSSGLILPSPYARTPVII